VALGSKSNLVDDSLRDVQAMAGCIVDDNIEIHHRGRQRRTLDQERAVLY